MLDTLVEKVSTGHADHRPVIEAVRRTLGNNALDAAFVAEVVLLPSEAFVGDHLLVVDPEAIHHAREALRADIGTELEALWRGAYAANAADGYEYTPAAKGGRRLRTVALGYIASAGCRRHRGAGDAAVRGGGQYDRSARRARRADQQRRGRARAGAVGFLRALSWQRAGDRQMVHRAGAVDAGGHAGGGQGARRPSDFTLGNPNRLRSLVGAFSVNQRAFHDPSAAATGFLADMILAVDSRNPQTAARLVPPLGRWRRFDEARQALMKAELQRWWIRPVCPRTCSSRCRRV